jgi:hypothetical protein
MPRPGRFTPGKETRYPLHRRLGGLQGQSGWLQKILPPLGFDPQPVASHYTDYAILAHTWTDTKQNVWELLQKCLHIDSRWQVLTVPVSAFPSQHSMCNWWACWLNLAEFYPQTSLNLSPQLQPGMPYSCCLHWYKSCCRSLMWHCLSHMWPHFSV